MGKVEGMQVMVWTERYSALHSSYGGSLDGERATKKSDGAVDLAR